MKTYHIRQSQNHMATTFEFVVSSRNRVSSAETVLSEGHRLVDELEDELSEFRNRSPVYQLNVAAPGVQVPFTEMSWHCFQRALFWEEQTQGSFSASAKSRLETGEPLCPFGWDSSSFTVWRTYTGAHLGFGALGKGFALDKVRALIEQAGFYDFFLSAGGSSVILSGYADQSEPWCWGWSWQKDEAGEPKGFVLRHRDGQPIAIGVSGTQEQGAHLIDPRNGQAVVHPRSALVAAPSAGDADALSTALFISGWEKAKEGFSPSALNNGLACIEVDEVPRWNAIFAKLWGHPVSPLTLAVSIFCASIGMAEEAVDLKDFGFDDFTPYLFDRNNIWILLPLIILTFVFWHLQNNNPKRTKEPHSPEKTP